MIKTLSKPWPWSTIPEPTPADWGFGMTICIASYCSGEEKFVCAVDEMLSTGDMSAENVAFKYAGLGEHWACMFACNDISPVKPMIRSVRGALSGRDVVETRDEVALAFKNAYQAEIKKKIEAHILPPGIGLDEFYESGLARLGADTFNRIFVQIQEVRLDVSFLVCGFSRNEPCLFTFTDPGKECDYDLLGFWAIGTGATNALGSLFNLKGVPLRFRSYDEVIWRVCEAKFYAESAQGVGRTTTVFFVGKDDKLIIRELDPLKGIWEATSNRSIPAGVEKTIDIALRKTMPPPEPPQYTPVLPAVGLARIEGTVEPQGPQGDGDATPPSTPETSEDQPQ